MTAAGLHYWYNCSSCISKWIWRGGKIIHILTYFRIVCNCMDIPFLFFPIYSLGQVPSPLGRGAVSGTTAAPPGLWEQETPLLEGSAIKSSPLALQMCTQIVLPLVPLENLELLSETCPWHRTTAPFPVTVLGFCAQFIARVSRPKAPAVEPCGISVLLCPFVMHNCAENRERATGVS